MAIRQRRGQAADLDVTQLQSGEIVVSLDTGDVTAKLENDEYVVLARKDEVERQAEQISTHTQDIEKLKETSENHSTDIKALSDSNDELNGDLVSAETRLSESITEILNNNLTTENTTNYSDMDVNTGWYLKNGVEKEYEGYTISGYVPVEYSDEVFLHYIRYHETNSGVALYDENKNYIADVDTKNVELVTYIASANYDAKFSINVENAKYIRYTLANHSEGKVQEDGTIYHIADAYAKVTHKSVLYAEPKDLEGMLKEDTLSDFLFDKCNYEPKKILTWIDDDTNKDVYVDNVKSICDTLGIKCTFATITDRWGNSNSASLEKLHQLQKEGFHITSHTGNHKRWHTTDSDGSLMFTAQELETDLIESLELLKNEGFIDSDMLVYPGSSVARTDIDVISIVKKWCSAGVLAGGTNWTKYGQGKYKINRTFFDKSKYDSAYYKGLLDNITEEGWVLFGSHSATAEQFDSEMITEVLQYALNDGWKIMTLNEAIKYRQKYYDIQEMFGL